MKIAVLALLVCLVAIAYVQAAPVDETIIGDSVEPFHPADDSEFSKKALVKGLIILKVKKVKKLLKG
ncbi:CLUMA_CG001394, isoform A [Clunio marinus]|uniref:CLUMA_CG001394, isoform A n=1 Tax=Clunio marinus TaxID=568069 RepID=A0A1J1HMB6_9DIPT|nr:CLUMA_CG001394, isoform A [Clunio marinus]